MPNTMKLPSAISLAGFTIYTKMLISVLKQDHLKDTAVGANPRGGGGGNHLLHNSRNVSGHSPGKLWVTTLEYEGLFIWMELISSNLFIFHLGNYLILQESL